MVEFADVAGAEGAYERHEHAELRAGLDQVHAAARAAARATLVDVAQRLGPVEAWLTNILLPHVAWEGAVIFPEVDDMARNVWPTSVMRFDHMQIERAARDVEKDIIHLTGRLPTADERNDLYDDLIGLEVIVRSHLEREEQFLLPILDGRFD